MTEDVVNAGYTIIECFPVGEQGFAIGHSETAPSPYATWQFRIDSPSDFFWGHYILTKEKAYEDYRNRINAEIGDLSERTHKSPLLPPFCYTLMPSSGEIIKVERGCKGYGKPNIHQTGNAAINRKIVDELNRELGVTRVQEEAMLAGSMFGWHTKAANPRSYDENGQPKCIRKLQRNRQEQER